MRNSELSTGIEVEDHNGKVIGKSKVAAKKVKIINPLQQQQKTGNWLL